MRIIDTLFCYYFLLFQNTRAGTDTELSPAPLRPRRGTGRRSPARPGGGEEGTVTVPVTLTQSQSLNLVAATVLAALRVSPSWESLDCHESTVGKSQA